MDDESKIKRLEDENYRLLEVAKLTREGVQDLERQNRELKAFTEDSRAKIKSLEEKCANYEGHIAQLRKSQNETQKSLVENEKKRLGKDLDLKAAEEFRLLEKIRALEIKCEQREIELKEGQKVLAQLEEKHARALKIKDESAALQMDKLRAVIKEKEDLAAMELEAERRKTKAGDKALAQQAEKHRLALRASEAMLAEQAEKHRLALKEYETKQRSVDEIRRNFEREKKTLAAELSGRTAEAAQLKASLQEASKTSEKLHARITELKEELQNATKQCKSLQSEKDRLELERQTALKKSEEKAASLAALGEQKTRLEEERKRLEEERKNLAQGLETKAGEEVRLISRVQELESRFAKKESEIRASEAMLAEQAEKHRLLVREYDAKLHAAGEVQRHLEQEKEQLELARQALLKEDGEKAKALAAAGELKVWLEGEKAQLEEKNRVLAQDLEAKRAEEVRLLKKLQEFETRCSEQETQIKTHEAMIAQQAERYRLTVKEHEGMRRAAEEVKRGFEKEKKDFAAALSGRSVEAAQLRADLVERGKTLGKLNARIAELKDKLQTSAKQYKALQSDKDRVEAEKQVALKQKEEKAAALIALVDLTDRLESEKKRLEEEKRALIKDLEAKGAEEARLFKKVQELEMRCSEQETQIKAHEAMIEQQGERHRLALKDHAAKQRAMEEVRRDLEKQKQELAGELSGRAVEVVQLRTDLDACGKTIEVLNARIDELKDELQTSAKQCESLRTQREQLEAEKQAVLKQDEVKAAALMEMGELKRRLEGEKARVEDEKRVLIQKLEAKDAEETRLLKKIEEHKARYAQKEMEIKAGQAALAEEKEKHSIALKALEAKLHADEEAKRHLEWEKKSLTGELSERTVEAAQLRTNLEEGGKTVEKLNAQIAALKEELQRSREQYKALQAEKEQAEAEKQAALKLNEKKIAIIASLEQDKKLMKSEDQRLWAERKNIESERKRFENEKKHLEEERKSFSKELEARVAEDARLMARIQDLENAKAAEEARLAKKIQELEMRCAQKESEIREGEAALAEREEKHRLALREYDAKQRIQEEARRDLEGARKALEVELSGKMAEAGRLKVNLEESGKTLERLNAQIAQLKEALGNAGEKYKALQAERDQVEAEKAAAFRESEEKKALLDELEKVKAQLEDEKKRLENVLSDLEAQKEQLETEKRNALRQNEEKAAMIAVLRNEKNLSKDEIEHLLAQKKGLEDERKRLDNEKARLEADLEARSVQLDKLTKQYAELNALISQTRHERDQVIGRAEDLERTIEKMEGAQREKEAAQDALEEELRREKELHAQVEAHARHLEEAFLTLEKKVNAVLQIPTK